MHRSFYDSICPYQPKNVEGCSKPVDHLLVNPNSGEKSQWTRCVKKWAANWIYFRMFLFDLCGRIGNDGENMDFLFGFWLCMQGTWQMFSWRWLQFIPLWRPMGNLACDFSEFWWWGCPIKTVFFLQAPPQKKQYVLWSNRLVAAGVTSTLMSRWKRSELHTFNSERVTTVPWHSGLDFCGSLI